MTLTHETSGRGNFSVSSKETASSGFFVMVHRYTSKAELKLQGVAEFVVEDIPLKNRLLATIKSTNYLTNALVCESAEDMVGLEWKRHLVGICVNLRQLVHFWSFVEWLVSRVLFVLSPTFSFLSLPLSLLLQKD